ncbi:MAG: hypothetical protein M1822_004407 [Bathelium mastoideum]|nr:MAG: hypothetical protein M1822_004407 [Bathelium mastoideum]
MGSARLSQGKQWKHMVWKHGPWTALSACIGFAVATGSIAAVLVSSNKKIVAAWPSSSYPVAIPVALTLLVGIANMCLAIAIDQAYTVAWWSKALRGARIKNLYFDLDIQRSISALLRKGRTFDRFALAALIAVAVSVLDGPIIQKASSITTKAFSPVDTFVEVSISNASLPGNFSGFDGDGMQADLLTPTFARVYRDFLQKNPIELASQGCNYSSQCTLTVPGPGLDVNCTNNTIAYNFFDLAAASLNTNNITAMSVDIQFGQDQTVAAMSTIYLTTRHKPDAPCTGNLIQQRCVLRAATVKYPVTIDQGSAGLSRWLPSMNETLAITNFGSDDRGSLYVGTIAGGMQTMLSGIVFATQSLYDANAAIVVAVDTATPFLVAADGLAASTYLTSDISDYNNCTMTWDDPTTDIINTLRELMFRSAIAATTGNESATAFQLLPAMEIKTEAAYESRYEYFGIALACMLVQVLCIFLLLHGWHRLGRNVSLNAFEIGRAFQAPLLQVGSTNNSVQELLEGIGEKKIRYGEVLTCTTDGPLIPFLAEDGVLVEDILQRRISVQGKEKQPAKNNSSADEEGIVEAESGQPLLMGELAFGEPALVQNPRVGTLY